ncbi:hypothetical protein RRG08_043390 [Elysia crispata]|uniref:Uncharacterized protein n=1 Tax=Elysia crispata TaxID=231223 RepID=A0AAE1E4I2_9GAST|nr:hypothetical protein RRG08_043390 [Elysia crispata]
MDKNNRSDKSHREGVWKIQRRGQNDITYGEILRTGTPGRANLVVMLRSFQEPPWRNRVSTGSGCQVTLINILSRREGCEQLQIIGQT